MTPHQFLTDHRRGLVDAATTAMTEMFDRGEASKLEKAQLSHLVGVCNAAACAEEIELYLRYQASRERPSWPRNAADDVIRRINIVAPTTAEPHIRVAAWRLYAVYLARAFTYEKARRSEDRPPRTPERGGSAEAPPRSADRNHTGSKSSHRPVPQGGRR